MKWQKDIDEDDDDDDDDGDGDGSAWPNQSNIHQIFSSTLQIFCVACLPFFA